MAARDEKETPQHAGWFTRRFTHARMRAYFRHALATIQSDAAGRVTLDFDPEIEDARPAAEKWLEEHRTSLEASATAKDPGTVPPLSVVILAVGTRGDVQPFLPVAQRLQEAGHRVRLASHEEFRDLVTSAGIEFFPLAADPRELIAYMVRTGGRILPTKLEQIRDDVPRKREMIAEILESTWQACIARDPETPGAPSFRAEAIIANPPCFGHIHVAEALHVPLHMVFTMPWTPTTAFPHPLANLGAGEHRPVENWLSFLTIDFLTWAGSADLVNRFREKSLGLEPILLGEGGASLVHDNEVPTTYIWSPSFVPKPPDWGEAIEVAGFAFLDQASSYEPPGELTDFLEEGDAPFYIGFGSCVIEDPAAMTAMLVDAVRQAGVRAILSRGWAGLGEGVDDPAILVVGDLPHDWLFPHLAGLCHHGGAGTVAAGLRAGLPTIVVPFFGDQYFWGDAVARAGAGPAPIPGSQMDAEALAAALAFCAQAETRARAQEIASGIRAEDGAGNVVAAFHRHLPLETMRCALDEHHLARHYCEDCQVPLCHLCDSLVHEDHARRSHDRVAWRWIDWGVRPPANLVEGLEQGIGHAVGELFRSARDAVREPVRGAREEGARGLARGLGEAAEALVAGPVRGGISLARRITAAIEPGGDATNNENPGPAAARSVASLPPDERARLLARFAQRMADSRGD